MLLCVSRNLSSTILLFLLLIASPLQAQDAEPKNEWGRSNDIQLKLGGWSYHNKRSIDNYDYNQTHNGIGLEWTFATTSDERHNLSAGFFTMQDSFHMSANQAGFIYTYKPAMDSIFSNVVHYNLALLYVRRGFMKIHHTAGTEYDYYNSELYYDSQILPLPYLTLAPSKYFNVDFFILPGVNSIQPYMTYFFRIGLKLNSTPSN